MRDDAVLRITVRRANASPGFVVNVDKYPDNPIEFVALLNIVRMTCEKTISDFASQTGFATSVQT